MSPAATFEPALTVGRDTGLLVLHLKQQVEQTPDRVSDTLTTTIRPATSTLSKSDAAGTAVLRWFDGDCVARWEVEPDRGRTRLLLTTWVDGDDVDSVAAAGVRQHARFERLVRSLKHSSSPSPLPLDEESLCERYRQAVAAAIADAD